VRIAVIGHVEHIALVRVPADLNAFFDATVPFSSLWEFPSSTAPAKLTQLAQLHWKN
jgi:hypothetical protein